MSYLVLARKYRPKSFTEMVGQEHVVQALTNALTTQRLHHAYLFTGTRGVGKTTVSRILAKALNCETGITATPCGVCQSCTDIDQGRFVDYTELDAASNRGVEEIQQLLEQAVYKPVQGRFKVFMIDEVHMLSNTAFNAMLKTLEEPPPYLKFVLATTDPQKVPVTVLSRCLQFNLRPMAPQTLCEHLAQVLQAENVGFDQEALRLLARAARGSMRDALSLSDQAIAFGNGQLQDHVVRQMLGSVDNAYVLQLIDALVRNDGAAVLEICDGLRRQGLSAASTLEEMSLVLQHIAAQQVLPAAASDDEQQQAIAELAQRMPADETQLLYSLCLHGRAELGLAPDEYSGLVMVLLRLLAFKPDGIAAMAPAPAAEKKTLQPVQPLVVPVPAPAPVPTPAASVPAPWEPDLPPPVAEPVATPVAAPSAPSVSVAPAAPLVQVVAPAAASVTAPTMVSVSAPAAPAVVPTADAVLPPLAEPNELSDFWHGVVRQLITAQAIQGLVRELALQSHLASREAEQWLLHIERESLNQGSATREKLELALRDAGHAITLLVKMGEVQDSPARRIAHAQAQAQAQAQAIIMSDPLVQELMQDLGAKIVPGSVRAESS